MNLPRSTMVLVAFLTAACLSAATAVTDSYVGEMPSVERVMREMTVPDTRETAFRQLYALNQLVDIITGMAHAEHRFHKGIMDYTAEEQRLIDLYSKACQDVWHAEEKTFATEADKGKFQAKCSEFRHNVSDPRFGTRFSGMFGVEGVELFKLLFTPEFHARFRRVVAEGDARSRAFTSAQTGTGPWPSARSNGPDIGSAINAIAGALAADAGSAANTSAPVAQGDTTQPDDDSAKAGAEAGNSAVAHNRSGIIMSGLKQYSEAAAAFEKAIQLDPNDAAYHFNLGGAYTNLKEYEKAVAALREAVRLNPGYAPASNALGNAFSELKQHAEAAVAYREAIRLDPAEATYRLNLGVAYAALTEHEKAGTAFREALRLKPDYASANNGLGNSLYALQRYSEAAVAYRGAVRLNPNNPTYNSNLGDTYVYMKEYEKALAAFREALRLKPDYANANNGLGNAFFALKQYAEAAAAYQDAVRCDPKTVLYSFSLADAYFSLKEYEKAAAAFREALRLKPDYAAASNGLGNALYALERYTEAAAAFQEAVRLDPTSAIYCANLGDAYMNLQEYPKAVAAFREALRLKPDYAYPSNRSGDALFALGQYAEAAAAYEVAVRLEPNNAAYHYYLGDTYVYLKEREKAVSMLHEALRLQPDIPAASYRLGNVLYNQRLYADALAAYREAARIAPKEPKYLHGMGFAYVGMGKRDDAKQIYLKLQDLDKKLAQQLSDAINRTAAEPPANKSPAELLFSDGLSAYRLWQKLQSEKAYAQATEAFAKTVDLYEQALEFDPALLEAQSGLGTIYYKARHFADAAEAFKAAIALNPKEAMMVSNLGLCYLNLEQYHEAIATFEQAIRLKPSEPAFYLNLGLAYKDMGRTNDALQVYHRLEAVDKVQAQKLYDLISKPVASAMSAARPKTFANPKIALVGLPPGSFTMGADKLGDAARPAHRVTIGKGFFMGKFEVTQAQWQTVMGENPSFFKNGGGDCPVEQVSWYDAQEFISRLNTLNDGYKYRLPSEAEWEYAYRAGTTGYFYADGEIGWFEGNAGGKTHPVGGKPANAFGLYDMAGNVCEWCMDFYHDNYQGAPNDGSAWLEAEVQKYRVVRSGSFYFMYTALTAENRGKDTPDSTSRNNGFRIVAERAGAAQPAALGR
jgi:tetratricopeptide (TPR) repeat protein